LEAAAVGEDGFVPGDKRMNSSQFAYDFHSRPQIKMVRINEYELGT